MGHLKTFAKGVALGGIVGVIYGLFSSPKKGSEMKKEAKVEINKLVKKGKKVAKKAEKIEKKAVKKYKRKKK